MKDIWECSTHEEVKLKECLELARKLLIDQGLQEYTAVNEYHKSMPSILKNSRTGTDNPSS